MTTQNNQKKIESILTPAYGQVVCYAKVGDQKSLSIGLGKLIACNKPALGKKTDAEWRLGSYRCCWRLIERGKILFTNHSLDETIETLNEKIAGIKFGKLLRISNHTELDIRVEFDNQVLVDFLTTFADEDECFHLFCPEHEYVEFYSDGKWRIGKSNAPWSRDEQNPAE